MTPTDPTDAGERPRETLPRLRVDVIWTLLGRTVFAASQWSMVVILAKLLHEEAVGQFALGLAIVAPAMFFFNLQLRNVQATDSTDEFPFRSYFVLRLITTTLAMITICIVTWIWVGPSTTAAVILVVGVLKSIEAFADIVHGHLFRRQCVKIVSFSLLLHGNAKLLAFALMLWLTRDVALSVLAAAVASLGVFLTFDLKLAAGSDRLTVASGRSGSSTPDEAVRRTPSIKKLVVLAAPLGLAGVLTSLFPNVPRYFLQEYLGLEELGRYAAMAYFLVAGGLIVGSASQAAMPRLSRYFASGAAGSFVRVVSRLAMLGAGLGLAGVLGALLVGRPFLSIVYTPDYADNLASFVVLMLAGVALYVSTALLAGLISARWFGTQIVVCSITVAVVVVLSVILIPRLGLVGAAWSLTGAAVAQLLASLVALGSVVTELRRYRPI